MNRNAIWEQLRGGLIVSCQALADEPMHGKGVMAKMACAAKLGGACGIRANGTEDIEQIKAETGLPVIGIIKRVYPDSDVYITPTASEAEALVSCGADIIAVDATRRLRPGGVELAEFFAAVRRRWPEQLFMADCATLKEGLAAQAMGFDLVGTTLAGYTPETRGRPLPDFALLRSLADALSVPVIAEGGIWTPEELKRSFDCGAFASVVGTAITRPMEITKRFCAALQSK